MQHDLLQKILQQIAKGEVTRRGAAGILEITERHMNRLMNKGRVKRPRGQVSAYRKERRAVAQERRRLCLQLAHQVILNKISPQSAAQQAKCSVRAMYRWISDARAGRTE